MTTREKLLLELTACRWHAMKLLADESEERGETDLAAGWRWMADNERWPETARSLRQRTWTWRLDLANPTEVNQSEGVLPFDPRRHGGQLTSRDLAKLLELTARAAGRW